MEELVPKLLSLGEVGRVLEQLLRERVSIRDLGSILEALLETAPVNKNLIALVEASRQALGRRLIRPLLDGEGQLPVLLLAPPLEEEILSTLGAGVQPAAAGLSRAARNPSGPPPDRFCEATYRRLLRRGPPRASLSQSGPLSREALAGAGVAQAGGDRRRGDSSGDPFASGGNGALRAGGWTGGQRWESRTRLQRGPRGQCGGAALPADIRPALRRDRG